MNKIVVKILLIIVICLTTLVLSFKGIEHIKADSGWDSSYDSGSSWDYDSGSSWDYDSGSSNYGGSYSSSHSSCTTDSCKTSKLIGAIFGIVIFSIFGIILPISLTKRGNKRRTVSYNKSIIPKINFKITPNFDINEFNFKAYQIFYDVQMAWMDFNYEKLKELLTDELYNNYAMQLDALKIKDHKNIMKGFKLNNCFMYEFNEVNGVYEAKVYLDVEFYDYVENTKTGMILRGTDKRKLNNTYKLTFLSTKKENSNTNECPRCGASVEGNATGVCEYCKSKLVMDNYDWVMAKKEKISQR